MNINNIHGATTPFYLYDTALLRTTLDAINTEVKRIPNLHVHYAVKANAHPCVLAEILKAGLGIDCVSGGEIQTVLDAGFDPAKIVFAGVGKADWEIRLALEAGIFCFNVESKEELEVISQIAVECGKVAPVCLRINPDVGAHTHSHITTGRAEDKFGIAMEDMEYVIGLCALLPNIEFLGLHLHIGSQILEMEDFIALAHRTNELQDRLEQQGIKLRIINIGGGLGVDYDDPNNNPVPNFHDYFAVWAEHLKLRPGQELHCEPGRAIVAQCGSLITRVLYVKEGHEQKFVIVDAGMTELIRPALYGARHKIENITATQNLRLTDWLFPATDTAVYDVVGPICESTDVFAEDIVLPVTRRGDLIAIRSAGAYGETMASCYNCRPLPKGFTIDDLSDTDA
ncbi:MAG: diaminopimelate decarboxylase [Bacteroidaceae bacterium]|nr:diaminopimelate decarboxylase [Bacteroidaceae bacterium]